MLRKNYSQFKLPKLLIILLLSGDIHPNPGPSDFTLYALNIRSLLNPIHLSALHEIITDNKPDAIALTETWVKPSTTPAELKDANFPGYTLLSLPRSHKFPNPTQSIYPYNIGGGLAFLLRDSCHILSSPSYNFTSFEAFSVTLKLQSSTLSIFNIYRPQSSSTSCSFATFIEEFQTFLSTAATTPHEFVITGDFNIHVDNQHDNNATQFLTLLSSFNLVQHVNFPTHIHNHTLDLLITSSDSNLSPTISLPVFATTFPSDHFLISTVLNISPLPLPPPTFHSFRRIHNINIDQFISDISSSDLIINPPSNLNDLVSCYNSTLSSILDKHAPVINKQVTTKHNNPWMTPSLIKFKSYRRHIESLWKQSHSELYHSLLKSATNRYHYLINQAKKRFHANLIISNTSNPRNLWKTINSMLHRKPEEHLPTSSPQSSIPKLFLSFFSDKITKLRSSIPSHDSNTSPHFPTPICKPSQLSDFSPTSENEILAIIHSCPDKQCDLDPIPTNLLKKCLNILLPIITNIVNLSIETGTFPDTFKSAIVKPILKKPTLDKELLSNYRPISNLSFLSKLTEKIVKIRLQNHLSTNSLFNSHQSAYIKNHSTETVLLSLYDKLITAIDKKQVTCLCLLDLSAAFDTIDHSILITRLSDWFGITGTALSWLISYLTSRTSCVRTSNSSSHYMPVTTGVPQGSVLGPLLFLLYTTPLSTLINQSSVNHHLYADDTQLFISFSPNSFNSNIAILQTLLNKITSWTAANFLCLNPSKTEFLLIGLSQQLTKIQNPQLQFANNTILPSSTARNLGITFDSNLSFDSHITNLSRNCYYHIRDLRRLRSSLDYNTTKIIATSLVQSKLDYCNSLFFNLPQCQISRLQLIQNSLARVVTSSPKHSHVTPILKNLHWLKISDRINYKLASLTYKVLQTRQPSYLYSLISIQSTRSTRSSSIVTLSRASHSTLKRSNRAFRHAAPQIWNSLPLDLRQYSTNYTSDPLQSPPLSISHSSFHSKLKTHLFRHSYPP